MAFEKLLQPEHKTFLLTQVSRCLTSATVLKRMLEDTDVAAEYGFEPLSVSREAIWQQVAKLDPELVKDLREKYLSDFDSVYIAQKKNRVVELSRMYMKLPELAVKAKLDILRAVKDEIGEDMDKLAKALGQSQFNLQFLVVNGSDPKLSSALEGAIEEQLGNGTAPQTTSRGDKVIPQTPDLLDGGSASPNGEEPGA